ncbi:MAG: hypothetical protein RIS08_690 [Actinomycetota bacterium]
MVKYTVAMSIRMVCIIAGVFAQGWLMWALFALAIFLPYFAVIIANAQGPSQDDSVAKLVAPKISIKASDIKIVDDK